MIYHGTADQDNFAWRIDLRTQCRCQGCVISPALHARAQAEMAGSPATAAILDALNATRASARERQDELERRIRAEARKLRDGPGAGARACSG